MLKRKILVVDDEVSLCRVIKLNLEKTGDYEVLTETRGTNAFQAVCDFMPDLIILDIMMPDMDGADIENQLRESEVTRSIPIIFLTAVATHEDTQDPRIGGRYVLAKPVTIKKIIDCIEERITDRA